MSDPTAYYSKKAIQERVFGGGSAFNRDRREPHNYFSTDDYADEILSAAGTGDQDFARRVAHCLVRRVRDDAYNKGITDTKADVRKKLGL